MFLAYFLFQLCRTMDELAAVGSNGASGRGRVVSLLEGGYDTAADTLGLARCVSAHVSALRSGGSTKDKYNL